MSGPATSSLSPWIEAIGWMLLHSLWQGAGVAMVLAFVFCVLRRAPAGARYLAACAAMIVVVALPIVTLFRGNVPHPSPSIHHDAIAEPAILALIDLDGGSSLRIPTLADRLEPMLPAIVALWMAGVGVFSLRLLGGWIQARRWVRYHTRPLADPWPARVERLKERLGVRRAVALLESARVEVPMVVGWLRPAILVPVAALSGLSVPELEAILAHELAHIRRHDYLVNLIQCVVEVVMFYHPATWWISRAVRREREQCCDDLAVAICRDRATYARALAAMEGLRVPAFSPSPAANGGPLLARVRRVLKPQEESMNSVRIFAGLVVVLVAAPLWLARADDDQPAPATTAKTPAPPPIGTFPSIPVPLGPASTDRNDPFPNRTFADVVASAEQSPMCRGFIVSSGSQPPRPPAGQEIPSAAATFVERSISTFPETSDIFLDPPSEAEVWAKLPNPSKDHHADREFQRKNVRIKIEKFATKVDPVKVYPLAGPCQLVHVHYKCRVDYEELSWPARQIDRNGLVGRIDHKVEVVYIDKDHLRRALPAPVAASDVVDDRLDRLSREITELKSTRQRDRREQEQILDRLIGELEGLKRELRVDSKEPGPAPSPKIR